MSSPPLPAILCPGVVSQNPVPPQSQRPSRSSSLSASTFCLLDALEPTFAPRARSSLPSLDTLAGVLGTSTFDDLLRTHLGDKDSMNASRIHATKRRSQHQDEKVEPKENVNNSVRERVLKDSPIIAELRTNVIIKDEFTLVKDLTLHLAARYTRNDSAIMVQVDHSVCLALGGTFDPCYILTLTTGSSQMGPIMNRRNAALIQSFLADVLGVPAERGVVKFQPSPEENFAYNGTTLLAEIERREKQHEKGHGSRRSVECYSRKSTPSPKKSASKLNAEVKINDKTMQEAKVIEAITESKFVEPKTLTTHRPKTAPDSKRKSGTLPVGVSATILSPGGVFELPASDMERIRSTPIQRQSSGSNGLRMNPVSSNDSEYQKRPSSGMTRATSGEFTRVKDKRRSNSHLLSLSDPLAAPAPPPIRIQRPIALSPKEHSFLQNEYTKPGQQNPRSSNVNRMSAPISMREKPMRMLGVRETYIESLMSKPHLAKVFGSDGVISEDSTQELTDSEPTANTAKRRSTMTATPKIPESPIEPKSSDSKSIKSTKNGKRKSFLAAFRRSTVTAV